MDINTHPGINQELCGTPVSLEEGKATITMTTTAAMGADDRGLVHGGFIFGMADYAAMCAVNDPNVVLGAAETRFLKPVVVGEEVTAIARINDEKGKKRIVDVKVVRGDEDVFLGEFTCFVLEQHVLDA